MLLNKYSNYDLECGVDEAGRGCLAGPVTSGSGNLKPDFSHELINDSKTKCLLKRKINTNNY